MLQNSVMILEAKHEDDWSTADEPCWDYQHHLRAIALETTERAQGGNQ